MIHLNPYLCPSKIKEELKWNHTGQSNVGRPVDISDSTNGNSAACKLCRRSTIISHTINENSLFYSYLGGWNPQEGGNKIH